MRARGPPRPARPRTTRPLPRSGPVPGPVRSAPLVALALAAALCAACKGAPPPAPRPVEVKVAPVVRQDAVVKEDLAGDVRSSQQVDVRARVGGVLLKTHFTDGSHVEKGQVLFTIDPRELLAARADARARLAEARANLAQAEQEVERYRPLVEANAIPRQTYDTAVTTAQQSSARVDALRAVLTQADLSLGYATVRSPLSGRIGEAQVFPGTLVAAGQTVLATVSRDDPAWVYFSLSENTLLDLTRRYLEGERRPRHVTLTLSDGTAYPEEGHVNFADRAVDPRTGTITLRAEFPNPRRVLQPGMFVRAHIVMETLSGALLVPDLAVQDQLGRKFVIVVGQGDLAEQRPVTLGPRIDDRWVVEKGLAAGDRVVVEGLQKARPGTRLTPIAYVEAAQPPAPAPGSAR